MRAIKRAAEIFLVSLGVRTASLTIILVSGKDIRRINKAHLGHDFITDVITFDLSEDKARVDGEIYICLTEAARNARVYKEPLKREILRYVAHGILHLRGHDDGSERQRDAMRRQEDRLLAHVWR